MYMSKRMSQAWLVVVVFSVVLGLAGLVVASTEGFDPLSAIQSDYEAGNLTIDQKAILQITAIKKPEELPSKYQVSDLATGKIGFRTATPAILDIKNNWDRLSPSTQNLVSSYLVRPSATFTHDSPSGFFTLHYDTLGDDAVPTADTNGNEVPDFVERCAAYCDTSLTRHQVLGYRTPPPDNGFGGDDKFDVYFEEMEYYGYADPEGPGPEEWNDYYSYLVLNSDFIGFPPNNDPEGNVAGAAKATIAHEFHHCVQFAYDPGEPIWYMELDAVYMEDIVFDQVDDNYNYLPLFMNNPEKSLMEYSMHMYASFIWEMYLASHFDTSLMVSIWDGARYDDIFDVLSDTLWQEYGWSLDSAFAEFACWNYITGYRDDGLHYDEGASYPLVAIGQTHNTYPTYTHYSPADPAGYGACYIKFQRGTAQGNLRLFFNGDDSREWAAYAIKSVTDTQHELEKFVLTAGTYEGTLEIHAFNDYETVTLVGINLSEFSGAASYTYSAELFGDHAVSSVLLTIDTAIYSGSARDFEYQVFNTSPLDDVYAVTVLSDAGWIVPDVMDRFVLAGDSVILQVPIQPPVGTPLGESSELRFRATSKSDPDVYDEQTGWATTVLQHGDVNFDGLIDIGDLTDLISYLFIYGPEPQPVMESGNFDCDNGVDISDVTEMIRFLFMYGPPPVCNPF